MSSRSFFSVRIAAAAAAAAFFGPSAVAAVPQPAAARSAVPLSIDWTLSPAQIAATCKAQIADAKRRITALTAGGIRPTFATVVLPLETINADLNDRTAAQQFLSNVSTDKAVRDASQQCNNDESALTSDVTARPALYRALAAAKASNTAVGDAQKKLTDLWLTQSRRAGAALTPGKRAEFVKLNTQLTAIETAFMANLGNDATTVTLTTDQMAGVPDDVAAAFKKQGDTVIVPVNESTVGRFMENASDEGARKAFSIAYGKRGGDKNVALLQQAIAIRDRLAHLFGYSNWAAYVLADKMAGNPQRVESFLRTIDAAILPKARGERAELVALKGGEPFNGWDTAYYENKLRKEKYAVDQTTIKQYFPVQHTIDAVLGIYAKLLNVSFAKIEHPNDWNAEVLAYEVHDARSGVLLGTAYFDLFPRPGKYNHFANFPLIARRVLADGTVRAPMSVIVGNWSRPATGKPALLTHDDVETFFHEFGHNMAAMLANAPYETLTAGFRADFVEAPSQMLENWVWDPGILKEISANVTTGAPLPDDLIAKMIAARYVHYALQTTGQIVYAEVDMAYHSSGPKIDTTDVWRRTVAAMSPNRFTEGTHPQSGFGHLMSGYDAGYYGYLWSKVYAQDMFTAFASAGLENPTVGMRYRTEILAPARTYEPDAEVQAFLGRPMSPDAFYRELGIAPQSAAR
ncbi:MAG: M3 family metallopeptidase [Candidatus Velthaea sp.]